MADLYRIYGLLFAVSVGFRIVDHMSSMYQVLSEMKKVSLAPEMYSYNTCGQRGYFRMAFFDDTIWEITSS